MPNLIPDFLPRGTLANRQQPCLQAGSMLVLRPWQASDVAAVVTAYADPQIQRWHLQTKDEAAASHWIDQWKVLWQNESNAGWAITDSVSGAVLGRMGLREIHLDEGRAEAAYWVLPAARGRGVATAALQALTEWAFQEIGLHRLTLVHSVHNAPSCRVALKTGFDVEGVLRDYALHQDGWHDYHLHARLTPRRDHQRS
ncbi:MAG TPA: GNAT family N-acetyltransferase [Kineosporiaceae bacterium]|nr:GNAT family N-acetyltransferase [Kineosporiaceae bacterium]